MGDRIASHADLQGYYSPCSTPGSPGAPKHAARMGRAAPEACRLYTRNGALTRSRKPGAAATLTRNRSRRGARPDQPVSPAGPGTALPPAPPPQGRQDWGRPTPLCLGLLLLGCQLPAGCSGGGAKRRACTCGQSGRCSVVRRGGRARVQSRWGGAGLAPQSSFCFSGSATRPCFAKVRCLQMVPQETPQRASGCRVDAKRGLCEAGAAGTGGGEEQEVQGRGTWGRQARIKNRGRMYNRGLCIMKRRRAVANRRAQEPGRAKRVA